MFLEIIFVFFSVSSIMICGLCTGNLDDITTPIQTISCDIEVDDKEKDDTSEREERFKINEEVCDV